MQILLASNMRSFDLFYLSILLVLFDPLVVAYHEYATTYFETLYLLNVQLLSSFHLHQELNDCKCTLKASHMRSFHLLSLSTQQGAIHWTMPRPRKGCTQLF